MAQPDAEVLVAINGDDSGLTATLKRTSNRIAAFGHAMNGKITEGLVDPTKKAKIEFKDVSRIVGGIVVSKIFYGALGAIRNATDAVKEFNTELEYTKTVYATLFKDVNLAEEFTNVLKDFSAVSPFGFSDSSKAAQQLLSYGIPYKNIMYVMQGVMDAATVMGDPKKIEAISRALGQIFTKGVLKQEEVRQLAEAGIPAYDILREKLNLTAVAMQDISEQAIPAGVAIDALVDGINERFGAMTKASTQTMQGMVSNIKDNALMLMSTAIEPLFQSMRTIVHAVDTMLNKLREIAELKGIGGLFEYLIPDKNLQADIRQFIAILKELGQILKYTLVNALNAAKYAIIGFIRVFDTLGPIIVTVTQLIALYLRELAKCEPAIKLLTYLLMFNAGAWTVFKTAALGAKVLAPITSLILNCAKALSILAAAAVAHPLVAGLMILAGVVTALGIAYTDTGKKIREFFRELTAWNGIDPGKQILPDTKERTANLEKFNEKLDTTAGLLDATAIAADKAAKKAKKAQKDLLSFDEVFRLQQQDEVENPEWEMPDFNVDIDPFNIDDALPDFGDLEDLFGIDDFDLQLDKLQEKLKDILDTFLKELSGAFKKLGDKLKTLLNDFAEGVGKAVKDLGDKLKKFAEDLSKDLEEFGKILAREADSFVSWANGLKESAKNLLGKFAEFFNGIAEGIKKLWDQFKDKLPGILSGAGLGALIGGLIGGPLGAEIGAAAGALVGHFWNKFAEYLGITDKFDASIAGALLGAFMALSASFMGMGALATVIAGIAGYFGGLFWEGIAEYFGLEGVKKYEAAISSAIGAGFGFLIGLLQGGPEGALLGTLAGAYAGEFWSVLADNMGLTAAAKYAGEIAYGIVAVVGLALTDASARTVFMFAGLAKDWIAALVQGVQTGDWSALTTAFSSTLGALAYGPIGATIGRAIAGLYNVTYNAIKEHFGIDNSFKVQDLITASITSILTGLGAGLQAGLVTFGGQFGINLKTALTTGLKAGFAGFAASLAASALSNVLIDYLAKEFGKTKEDVERGKTYGAIGGVAGALVGSFFGPVGTAIGSALGTLAGSLAGLFAEDIVPVLTEFFTVTIPGIWNSFWGKASDVLSNIPYHLGVLVGHIANFGEKLGQVVDDALGPIGDQIEQFVQVTWPQTVANAANWILNLPTRVGEIIGNIGTAIGTALNNLAQGAVQFIQVTWPQMTANAANWILGLPETVAGYIEDIINGIGPALDKLGQNVVNFIQVTWPQMVATAANWILNLPETVAGYIEDIIEHIGPALDRLGQNVVTFIQVTWPQMIATAANWILNLPETIGGLIDTIIGSIAPYLERFGQAFVQFIQVTWPQMMADAANWILGLPDRLYQIGAETLQGFIDGFMSIFGPVIETVQGAIDEFIRGFTDTFIVHSPSVLFFEIGSNVAQGFIDGFLAIWETIITTVTGLITGFVDLFTTGFATLGEIISTAILPAATAISNFVTTTATEIATWTSETAIGLSTWATETAIGFTTWASEAAIGISTWVTDTATSISTWVTETSTGFTTWVTETSTGITQWASDTASGIGTWISDTTGGITEWASNTGTSFSEWVSTTTENITEWSTGNFSTLETWLNDTTTGFSTWVTDTVTSITQWATDTGNSVSSWVSETTTGFSNWSTETTNNFTKWITDTSTNFTKWASDTIDGITKWSEDTQKNVTDWATKTSTSISEFTSKTKSNIDTWISNVKSAVSTWATNFTQSVSTAMSNASNSISSFVSKAGSAISSWASSASSTISNIISSAANAASSIANLPGHASGGIFNREHVAMVSEGNKAEAIIPLQDAGAMQPFVDAVATGLAQYLGPVLSNMQNAAMQTQPTQSNDAMPPLYVGTLIADDRSLRELERKMQVIRMSENNRVARSR